MSNFVYIKLNCLPQEEDIQVDSAQFELFKRTYEESREYISDKDAIRSYYETAGRSPVFGKISSVSIGYVNDKELRINILQGEEKDIIIELFNLLNSDFFKNSTLVSWNFDFMLGFLRLRPLANGINISNYPLQVNDAFNKSWSRKKSVDVFDLVNPGWSKVSAINVFHTFGLDWKDILSGEDIYVAYRSGQTEEILNSNVQFLHSLVNTHRILTGEEIVSEVVSSIKEAKEVIVEEKPLLEKLHTTGQFTEAIQQEVKNMIGKKKLTKKDRKNISKILLSVYQQKGDKVAIKKAKKEEVEKFIETL